VPSRSETDIVIFVREPGGSRMTARVVFAVATAFMMISSTSLCESALPAFGPTRYPSGGNVPAVADTLYEPAKGPGDVPAGCVVWATNGSAMPPTITTPGGGS